MTHDTKRTFVKILLAAVYCAIVAAMLQNASTLVGGFTKIALLALAPVVGSWVLIANRMPQSMGWKKRFVTILCSISLSIVVIGIAWFINYRHNPTYIEKLMHG